MMEAESMKKLFILGNRSDTIAVSIEESLTPKSHLPHNCERRKKGPNSKQRDTNKIMTKLQNLNALAH